MRVKQINALDVRGSLIFQPEDPPQPLGRYTFQRTLAGHGNVAGDPTRRLQLRRCVIPFDPQTPEQLANRSTFAAAIAEWHTLSAPEKKTWSKRGAARNISGLNALISARCRAT